MSLDFTFLCKMKGLPSKVFLKLNVVKGQSVLSLFFFLFFFSFLHFISFHFQNVADQYSVLLYTSSSQLAPHMAQKFSTIQTGL